MEIGIRWGFFTIIARQQYKYLKQLFYIKNAYAESGQQVLSVRIGAGHAGFAISNKSGSELFQLAYCSMDSCNETELTKFFETYSSLLNSFYEVLVGYEFPESIFISSKGFKQEDAGLLLKAFGCNNGNSNIISELIAEWQLYNVYAAPKEVQEWLDKKFPSARHWHQYSLGIKNINAANACGSLMIDFRTDDFSIIAVKGSKFLLAQSFEYTTPGDVLYYLLKICQQFSLSQQEVQLQLSGLIDKESSLYKELHQYFIHIEFREANWKAGMENPAHFFTSLNDLAKCAS